MIQIELPLATKYIDPAALLAALRAGAVTADLADYLRAPGALEEYEAAVWFDLSSGRASQEASSLAQDVVAAWREWIAK